MGNLKDLRCYLAGPIEHVKKEDAAAWRLKLAEILRKKYGVKVFDPCMSSEEDLNTERDYIIRIKKEGKLDELREKMKKIVRLDLRCVDLADFLIVNMPADAKTFGTAAEIILADKEYKPVLIVCEDGKNKLSDWLYGIIPIDYIFDSFDSLLSYLDKINSGEIYDRRWQFIQFT